MELVISMGLVGLLALVLVVGNVFVQKVLANWSTGNRLYEEGEWILTRLSELTQSCDSLRISPESDRFSFYSGTDSVQCVLKNKGLMISSMICHLQEVLVDDVEIRKVAFADQDTDSSVTIDSQVLSGRYQIKIKLSYRGKSDVIQVVTRNSKAYVQNVR
jgi:hypothetical protein